MGTKVIIGGTTRNAVIVDRNMLYELVAQAADSYDENGIELLEGELGKVEGQVFVIGPPPDLEPCKSMAFDDRYTGKCKKLRREARGW